MRRLLALGLGCLASFTASSEDLLTIFDQAVVNDPTVREAEFTRKATREARPQAWAAYLPQINGNYNKGETEGNRLDHRRAAHRRIPADPERLRPAASSAGQQFSFSESSGWSVELRQTIFSWHGLVGAQAIVAHRRPGGCGLRRGPAGPGVARFHALLRRARGARQRAGPAGVARRHLAPARAGRQAIRSGPHRHHRRAGSARRA